MDTASEAPRSVINPEYVQDAREVFPFLRLPRELRDAVSKHHLEDVYEHF